MTARRANGSARAGRVAEAAPLKPIPTQSATKPTVGTNQQQQAAPAPNMQQQAPNQGSASQKPVDDRKATALAQKLKTQTNLKPETLGQDINRVASSVGAKPDDVPGLTGAVFGKLQGMGVMKEEEVDEDVSFDGKNLPMEHAFAAICDAIGFNDGYTDFVARDIERRGAWARPLNPRSPLRKWTEAEWQEVNRLGAGIFGVSFDGETMTIKDLT